MQRTATSKKAKTTRDACDSEAESSEKGRVLERKVHASERIVVRRVTYMV